MDLNIKYDELISVGSQVTEKREEFQKLLTKIQSVNNELQRYWEGSDASKYSNAITKQIEDTQKLSDTISEIGTFLVKIGNAYRETSEANANAINN